MTKINQDKYMYALSTNNNKLFNKYKGQKNNSKHWTIVWVFHQYIIVYFYSY